ncbi:MAG: hypothetical protein ACJ8IK_25485 [Burkholderiaceae bacterium]
MTRPSPRSAIRALANWAAFAVLLGTACLAPAAHAAGHPSGAGDATRAAAPVRVGSPAWNDLLALPLLDHDALQLPAADVLARWQRPDESDRLRRAVMLAQLRIAGGAMPLPNDGAGLATLWTEPMPRVPVDDLYEAWQAALQRGLSVTPREDDPSGGAYAARRIPDVSGFWRMDEAGHVAVLAAVRNETPVRLAPGEAEARASWDRPPRALDLRCRLMTKERGIAPGASAPLYCVADAMPPGVDHWPDRWTWRPPRLVTDDELEGLAAALSSPVSTAALSVLSRDGGCQAQDNCSDAQRAALAQAEQARMAARASETTRWEKDSQDVAHRDARKRRRDVLVLAAAAIAGQVIFVVLARLTGSVVPSSLLVMGGACVVSFWFWRAAQEASRDSFLPLVLAIFAVGAIAGGACLCVVYSVVFRLFFAPRD